MNALPGDSRVGGHDVVGGNDVMGMTTDGFAVREIPAFAGMTGVVGGNDGVVGGNDVGGVARFPPSRE